VWFIWKRKSFQYLSWMSSIYPPSLGCRLCRQMNEISLLLLDYSGSKTVLNLPFHFPGIPCGDGRLHTTGNGGGVACCLPRRGRTADNCGTAWAQSVTYRAQLVLKCSKGWLIWSFHGIPRS
jgi:hypothetical protein